MYLTTTSRCRGKVLGLLNFGFDPIEAGLEKRNDRIVDPF